MTEEDTNIIPVDATANPEPQKHFPVIAQLSILGVVMIGLFGAFLFPHEEPEPAVITPQIDMNDKNYPEVPQKIEEVSIKAQAAYVWDVRSQRALYSKNADQELPLASITKLMTTLLAYELVEDDKQTTVPLSAIMQEGNSGLFAGEQLEIQKLRSLALVSSSNDAAFTLAASVGQLLGDGDPATQFVKGMNIRAQDLGLSTMEFWNTTGLDLSDNQPGAIGSARDVSFLMEHIISNYPEIIAPTQESNTRVYNSAGAYHEVSNTNPVVREIPNLIGSKTGYTDLAGGNLTIAFDSGYNRPIVITVLGSTIDERFTDVLTLVEAVQKSVSQ